MPTTADFFAGDETSSIGSSNLVSLSFWGGPARATAGLRDGDFSKATPTGPPLLEYPLQAKGDKSTVILRQKFIQAIESITALAPYSVYPEKADAYLFNESKVNHVGQGLGVWERAYATVPRTRVEYQKFPYPYQYYIITGGVVSLGQLVRSVTSQIVYEYFLETDRQAYQPLQKLEMSLIPTQIQLLFQSGLGNLTIGPGTSIWVSTDPLIVAEDSDIGYWNWPIMYRATRWVPGPTLAFIGATTNLPV